MDHVGSPIQAPLGRYGHFLFLSSIKSFTNTHPAGLKFRPGRPANMPPLKQTTRPAMRDIPPDICCVNTLAGHAPRQNIHFSIGPTQASAVTDPAAVSKFAQQKIMLMSPTRQVHRRRGGARRAPARVLFELHLKMNLNGTVSPTCVARGGVGFASCKSLFNRG